MADPTSPLTPIASQTSVVGAEAASPVPAQIKAASRPAGQIGAKGRGKRASGADSIKQQDGDAGDDGDGQPPKKRRAAAASGRAKRVIDESDDEEQELAGKATGTQQDGEHTVSEAAASPASGNLKLKLKLAAESRSSATPAVDSQIPDNTQSSSSTSTLPPTVPQPTLAPPLTVDNLFDDAVAPSKSSAEAAISMSSTNGATERVKPSKVLPPGRLKATQGSATPNSDAEASSSRIPKKAGSSSATSIARSGSTASLSSAKKPIKRPTGNNSSTSTPRHAAQAPPVKAAEPSFLDSLFSGIVPQTEHEKQAQKEREEKAKAAKIAAQVKEKEEKAKLAANANVRLAKEKERKEKEQATNAALNLAAPVKNGNTATPKTGMAQPSKSSASASPSVFVQNSRLNLLGSGRNSNLQARLAGQHESRKDEIQRLRSEARREREKVAAVSAAGGFDLLAQSLEMAAVEVPFLKDWNSHQQLAYQAKSDRPTFPFYNHRGPLCVSSRENGISAMQEEEDEDEEGQVTKSSSNTPAQPLPHPWTFGAAFIFAGARK